MVMVEALNFFLIPRQVETRAMLPDNAGKKKVLGLLNHGLLHIDDLIRASDIPAPDTISVLTLMNSKG